MLYAFYGTDTVAVRSEAQAFIDGQGNEGSTTTRMTADTFSPEGVQSAAGSESLFGGKQIFVLDTPSEDAAMFTYIFDNLDLFAESSNVFVLIEGALKAPEKKKLAKHAAEPATEATAPKGESFNVFTIGDALLRRDKKSLWMGILEARKQGIAVEQIVGLIASQLKSLRLAALTSSAAEAGMKDYPYRKAKEGLTKFETEELEELSRELITLYHEGHAGEDMEASLERWVLRL